MTSPTITTTDHDRNVALSVPDVELWWLQDEKLKGGFEALNKGETDALL